MRYSVIIPVYNRPDEVDELLESLERQTFRDFEVIVVEDGSSLPCESVVAAHADRLDVHYFSKDNSGPGQTRNYGAMQSHGEYLIILDSDVIVPPGYFETVEKELSAEASDAFGGPDRAHESFTDIQKAISYSMTSFFTTGGIRGGKRKMDKFYPRSFNMGIRSEVYSALGGFSKMRFGEDIDLSIRIFKGGYKCRLFPDAWVYHKRRTDLRKFFRQVYNSGIARINLFKKYPESLKPVHLLPACFTVAVFGLLAAALCLSAAALSSGRAALAVVALAALAPLSAYALLIFIDSTLRTLLSSRQSLSEPSPLPAPPATMHGTSAPHPGALVPLPKALKIGLLSVAASFVQLSGYGLGFLNAFFRRVILRRPEFEAFRTTFYK